MSTRDSCFGLTSRRRYIYKLFLSSQPIEPTIAPSRSCVRARLHIFAKLSGARICRKSPLVVVPRPMRKPSLAPRSRNCPGHQPQHREVHSVGPRDYQGSFDLTPKCFTRISHFKIYLGGCPRLLISVIPTSGSDIPE